MQVAAACLTGFRTVANGFEWPRSQGARAAAISKLKDILKDILL
jgi:hypothetical protein